MTLSAEPPVVLTGDSSLTQQIESQVRATIVNGQLRPDEQLPSVRSVTVALAVNPQAVEQAYAYLEREGFMTIEEGSGAYVTPRASWTRTVASQEQQMES